MHKLFDSFQSLMDPEQSEYEIEEETTMTSLLKSVENKKAETTAIYAERKKKKGVFNRLWLIDVNFASFFG